MKHADSDIWTLIAKHLKGDLSPDEAKTLKHWKERNPENRTTIEQIEAIWNKATIPNQHYHPDVERGWQHFRFIMDSERGVYGNGNGQPKLARFRSYRMLWAVAASVLLILGIGYFVWQVTDRQDIILLTTGEGEKTFYYLPDSSQVWLNENTTLSYAADFNRENRVVYLSGEAFFEVRKAEGRRFTVFSGPAKTEVIGTSFNVSAYEGSPVKVQVVTGKVAFSPSHEDNSVFLEPGMEAMMNTDNQQINKADISDPNFRAWQNKQLVFSNTSLEQVIYTLEKNYETEIVLANPELVNCRYTATFKDAELSEILNVLAVTGNLILEQKGNRYIISGKGCQ